MAILIKVFIVAYFTLCGVFVISTILAFIGAVRWGMEERIDNPCEECKAECENRKEINEE